MSLVESVFKLIFHRQRRLSQPNLRLGPLLNTFKIRLEIDVVMVYYLYALQERGDCSRRKEHAGAMFLARIKIQQDVCPNQMQEPGQ